MTTQVPQFGNVHIRFRRAKHFDASFTASFGAFEKYTKWGKIARV
jgi:hypothetical protein